MATFGLAIFLTMTVHAQTQYLRYNYGSADNYLELKFLTEHDYTNPPGYAELAPPKPITVDFGRPILSPRKPTPVVLASTPTWEPSIIPKPEVLSGLHIHKIYAYALFEKHPKLFGYSPHDSVCVATFTLDSNGLVSFTNHTNPAPHSEQHTSWTYTNNDQLSMIFKKFENAEHYYGYDKYLYEAKSRSLYIVSYEQNNYDPETFDVKRILRQQYDEENRLISVFSTFKGYDTILFPIRIIHYDKYKGRIESEDIYTSPNVLNYVLTYKYDPRRQKTSIYQTSVTFGDVLYLEYFYDNEDRCVRIKRYATQRDSDVLYTYNPDGTLSQTEERNEDSHPLYIHYYYSK